MFTSRKLRDFQNFHFPFLKYEGKSGKRECCTVFSFVLAYENNSSKHVLLIFFTF